MTELELFCNHDVETESLAYQVTGQLMPSSRSLYVRHMTMFLQFIRSRSISLPDVCKETLIQYREYLADLYAKSTASTMLTVAKMLCREAHQRGIIALDPTQGIKTFALENESPRTALSLEQCQQMLHAIDCETPTGKRDFALLSVLIRTGIRRAELVALKCNDIGMERGYYYLIIQHGKGDKRRLAKIAPDIYHAIVAYLATRGDVAPENPLFVSCRKGGQWTDRPIHPYGGLNYILANRAAVLGVHLTPHDLRATFATLAFEGNAPLLKVQLAMGHASPQTTERYHRRKDLLDDAATDYIHLT